MIITLIVLGLIIIGVIAAVLYSKTDNEIFGTLGVVGIGLGAIAMVFCLMLIISSHVNNEKEIHTIKNRHDSLVAQLEVINSDYEDVSKSSVIASVYDWNEDVYKNNYNLNNKWTNWFYDKDEVAAYEYIDIEDYLEKWNKVLSEENR